MAKDAYYFPHDSNARHDPKILAMRSVYGIRGYGVYWIIIEMLREQENYKLKKDKYIWNAIAMQVQCNDFCKEDAKQFVSDCIHEFGLLQEDDEYIWSASLLRRMEKKDDLSEKRRQAALARWGKSSNDAVSNDVEQTESNSNANVMQMHSISNAIKEKKNKKNNNISSSRQKRVYDEDSPYYQLALRLYHAIQRNLPEFKEPNLQNWADDMRKLAEIDGKQPENIAKVIDWVQSDSFWWKNVMSASKLRKQYDRLVAEIRSRQKPNVPQTKSDEPRSHLQVIDLNNLFGT
jgi:hypothetical protein